MGGPEADQQKRLAALRPPARDGQSPLLPGLAGDPFEGPHCQQAQQQQVVPAEAGGVLPFLALLIATLEGDIEHGTLFGVLPPDAGADRAVADGVDRFVVGVSSLIFHFRLSVMPRPSGRFVFHLVP